MASVLCDPNYDPNYLYRSIEPLLYLHQHVYLWGPSQGNIEFVGGDWRRIKSLIECGFVIPVGRDSWFDERKRNERYKLAATEGKKRTFRWGGLDEMTFGLGHSLKTSPLSEKRTPGYIIIKEDVIQDAERLEWIVPQVWPEGFRGFVAQVQALRGANPPKLPRELTEGKWEHAQPEELAANLVYHTAGDIYAAHFLQAKSIFSTPEMGTVYHAVKLSFVDTDEPESSPFATVPPPETKYWLGDDQLDIALRLANQISADIGPLDLGLLKEYRDTQCFEMFRDYVSSELEHAEGSGENAAERASDLKKAFDGHTNFIERFSNYVGTYGSAAPAE